MSSSGYRSYTPKQNTGCISDSDQCSSIAPAAAAAVAVAAPAGGGGGGVFSAHDIPSGSCSSGFCKSVLSCSTPGCSFYSHEDYTAPTNFVHLNRRPANTNNLNRLPDSTNMVAGESVVERDASLSPTQPQKLTLEDEYNKTWSDEQLSDDDSGDMNCLEEEEDEAEEEEEEEDDDLDVGMEQTPSWTLPAINLSANPGTSPAPIAATVPSVPSHLRGNTSSASTPAPPPSQVQQQLHVSQLSRHRSEDGTSHTARQVDLSSRRSTVATHSADKMNVKANKFVWFSNIVAKLMRAFSKRKVDPHEDLQAAYTSDPSYVVRECKHKPPAVCALPKVHSTQQDDLSLIRGKKKDEPRVGNSRSLGKVKKRRRRRRPVTICTTNCRYDVVRRVSRRLGMKDVAEEEPWNVYWTDLSISPERCKEMKRFQKINHFPGMAEICRKDLLARNLNRMYRLFPRDFNFFPKTWCLPADLGDLNSYARTRRNKTYILKPDTGCQGKGIFLTRNVRDLKPHTRMICQAYISKPFLVDGYKFDMRVYTLVTSCDPLRVFVYKDGLVRFCTIPYHEPNPQNTNNVFMHLTNYAVNKHSRMYVVDDEAGSKRKISTLNKWLESKNYNVEEIWEEIDELIVKTLIAALPVLRHNYHACFPSHDFTFACFELLGFDILLDHKLKPFILEVNHSPSFHTEAQIDRDIKESLLHDTFGILNLSQYDKRKVIEEDRKRVRERLLQNIHRDRSASQTPSSREVLNKRRQRRFTSSSDTSVSSPPCHGIDNVGLKPSECSMSMSEVNPWKAQFDWEDNNLGNYRRVYPHPNGNTDKYGLFFHQNLSTLFQETAASRAREEACRQQRDLYESLMVELGAHRKSEVRQKEEEARRLSASGLGTKRRDYERIRPESPLGMRRTRPLITRSKRNSSTSGQPVNPTKKFLAPNAKTQSSFYPMAISESEENERNAALSKRSLLVQSQGVVKMIYEMMKKNKCLCAEDLRKYSSWKEPVESSESNSQHQPVVKTSVPMQTDRCVNMSIDGGSLFSSQYPKLPSLLSLIQKSTERPSADTSTKRQNVMEPFGLEVSCNKAPFRVRPDW